MRNDLTSLPEYPYLPQVRGRYSANAPLGAVGWFRTGGTAEVMFRPADRDDLLAFLQACPQDVPVTVLGVLSNTIVRDGGIKGVVIRLGRDFAEIDPKGAAQVYAGAAALDVNVAQVAASASVAGLEFLCGVPGTMGGALRMNAGAYGTETKDVLISADLFTRNGELQRLTPQQLNMRYRATDTPDGAIFVGALLQGQDGDQAAIEARMEEIRTKRADSQPIKSQTGGSTFANPTKDEIAAHNLPEDASAWKLVDAVDGRGLTVGGAQMSEKHCNFMINTGTASAADLETLGEEIRKRVLEKFGYALRWEIKRIGEP
jgi:UDP-N-acetylmuramate dehydrogenase